MTELTDLEICKRIAEIESVELFNSYNRIFDKKKLKSLYMDGGVKWVSAGECEESFFTRVYSSPSSFLKAEYNPITNDALCFQLMIKHTVYLEYCLPEIGYFASIDGECDSGNQESPNRAICLSIIEASGDWL